MPETVEYDGESYTVVGIGDEAFNNCWGLKAVSLPSTLQSIGKLAFGYCTSLRSVTIPEEVTTVDNEAFTGCSALASVTIGGSVDSYKAHPTWSNFLEIRQNSDIPTKIGVVDGAIVVKGSDNVRVYSASGAQVYSGAAGRIELPGGIYLVATDSVSKKVRL